MANLLKALVRRTIYRQSGNLISFDNPYAVIARTLRGHQVTGILDAGASHGRVTRKLMRLFPAAHAYAFEPAPLYRQQLDRFADEERRFHPQYYALSNMEGIVELQITESPGTTSLFSPNARLRGLYPKETTAKAVEEVEMVTLDQWAERNGNPTLQVMKLDIQGGELGALQGGRQMLAHTTLLVYAEVFFNPLYDGGAIFSEIDLCLRGSGFVLQTFFKPRCDGSGTLIQAMALYLHAGRLGL